MSRAVEALLRSPEFAVLGDAVARNGDSIDVSFGLGWSELTRYFIYGYSSVVFFLMAVACALHIWQFQVLETKTRVSEILSMPITPNGGLVKTAPSVCYRMSCSMWILRHAWYMAMRTGSFYLLYLSFVQQGWLPDSFDLKNKALSQDKPAMEFNNLAEPYIIVFGISRCFRVLARRMRTLETTLFMRRCPPAEADYVVADFEGEFEWCHVKLDGGLRKFELKCFIFVLQEGRFVCPTVEPLTQELVNERVEKGGLDNEQAVERLSISGLNRVNFSVPGIFSCFYEECDNYFYIYQLSVMLWFGFFADPWVPLTWFSCVIVGALIRAFFVTRLTRMNALNTLNADPYAKVNILRNGRIEALPPDELVPGDLFLVERGMTMPCDAVIIQGTAMVYEAMLTGEPLPASRVAVDLTPGRHLNLNCGTLYAGSQVITASGYFSGDSQQEDCALAFTRWTGSTTFHAILVRLWQSTPPEGLLQHFSGIMSFFLGMAYVAATGLGIVCFILWRESRLQELDITTVIIRSTFIILPLCNPMMGVAMAMGQHYSMWKLSQKGLLCLLPGRISMAGRLDTMVLDKTGTITEANMFLKAVDMIQDETLGHLLREDDIKEQPLLHQCWISALSDYDIGEGPRPIDPDELTRGQMQVLRVLPRDQNGKLSGCICKLPNDEIYLFVRGAPQIIQALAETCPKNFAHMGDNWGMNCFYVLGCAIRRLGSMRDVTLPREELVRGMTACGLLLFLNPIKKDSEAAVCRILNAGIQCVVCTGDSLGSGVAIARKVGIITEDTEVYRIKAEGLALATTLIQRVDQEQAMNPNKGTDSVVNKRSTSFWNEDLLVRPEAVEDTLGVLETGAFAVEQEDWDGLMASPMLPFVITRLRVFGRMLPDGKVSVVHTFQELGQVVGMCGDGSNDCGAMRAAHVGFAISADENSLVAPFMSVKQEWAATNSNSNPEGTFGVRRSLTKKIESLLQRKKSGDVGEDDGTLDKLVSLLIEGRACMASNMAVFSYYVGWAATISFSELALIARNQCSLSTAAWFLVDILLSVLLPAAMVFIPAATRLTGHKPSGLLLGPRNLLGIFCACVAYAALWSFAIGLLNRNEFYTHWDSRSLGIASFEWNRMADTFESEVTFILVMTHVATLGVLYSFGGSHRQPIIRNLLLVTAYLALVAYVSHLFLTKGTKMNCYYRVNCDAATHLRFFPDDDCFIGPQLVYWGQNFDPNASTKPKLAELVDLARKSRTCLPPVEVMDEYKVPDEWRDLGRINNILSDEYTYVLLGLVVGHTIVLNTLFVCFVYTKRIDKLEKRVKKRIMLTKAGIFWSALPTWMPFADDEDDIDGSICSDEEWDPELASPRTRRVVSGIADCVEVDTRYQFGGDSPTSRRRSKSMVYTSFASKDGEKTPKRRSRGASFMGSRVFPFQRERSDPSTELRSLTGSRRDLEERRGSSSTAASACTAPPASPFMR